MQNNFTLGSLFDGSGGFPLAGAMCGIVPVWASEIDPFCVSVTSKRFPGMRHLGDITKINGAEIPPVDIITFGSPCQDMSVAGKQAGLHGDKSVLFLDAVRIIKEMREHTNGEYPKYAVWENVPGAFSSSKGEDFRCVLEELAKIKDGNVLIPRPVKRKWQSAGSIVGDGFSIAWRTLDAQFWGVPQRRKRIFLIADFGCKRAAEILFKRESLSRNFAESRKTYERTAPAFESSAGISGYAAGFKGKAGNKAGGIGFSETVSPTLQAEQESHCLYDTLCFDNSQITSKNNRSNPQINDPCHTLTSSSCNLTVCASFYPQMKAESQCYREDNLANTVVNGTSPGFHNAVLCCDGNGDSVCEISPALTTTVGNNSNKMCAIFDNRESVLNDTGGGSISVDYGVCPTLRAQSHVDGQNYCIAGNTIDRQVHNGGNGKGVIPDKSYTLNTIDRHAVMAKEVYSLDRAAFNQGENALYSFSVDGKNAQTLTAKGPSAVCCDDISLFDNHAQDARYKGPLETAPTVAAAYGMGGNTTPFAVEQSEKYKTFIVRRITPKECCRLQGFPDWWCEDIPHKDTPEYRMWGNGVALPCVLYVIEGIAEMLNKEYTEV